MTTDHGSQGIGQWRLDRLSGLERFAEARGLNPADGVVQFNYAFWELENLPRHGLRWLNAQLKNPGGRSIANLTANFSQYFESPSKKYEHLDERIAYAEKCVKAFQPQTEKPVSTGEAIGAGTAVVGSAGSMLWMWSQGIRGPILAIFVTLTIAAIVLAITIIVQKMKARAVAEAASASIAPAVPDGAGPIEELRHAIDECKTSHEALDAAEAVFMMHVKEIDTLKNELEQLRRKR